MPSGFIVSGVKDALAVALGILESAKQEVVWLVPPSFNSLSRNYDFIELARAFVQQGGASRGIVPISHENVEEVQMSLDNGENVRHSEKIPELFMYIGDGRQSISAINIGIRAGWHNESTREDLSKEMNLKAHLSK